MAAARRPIGEAGWGWSIGTGIISIIYFLPVLWIILTAF
jgi:multiple sugar transport system permease protein